MTNYYEELGLDRNLSLEEIKTELTRLESTWKRREITNPEQATCKLALIIQARKVFETEETRKDFDDELDVDTEGDSSDSSLEEYTKYLGEYYKAWDFYRTEQWDLAKIAIDNALALHDVARVSDANKCDSYKIAMEIYVKNAKYEQALEFANKKIMLCPDEFDAYQDKLWVLEEYIENMQKNNIDASQHIHTFRVTAQATLKKAKEQNDSNNLVTAFFNLAVAYFSYPPIDFDLVEQYAKEALALDPNYNNAKQMLHLIEGSRRISYDELKQYMRESSPYEKEIDDMVQQIIASGIKAENDYGWQLTEKSYFGKYPNSYDSGYEERESQYLIYLDKKGQFVQRYTEQNDYFTSDDRYIHNSPTVTESICRIHNVMQEMDIDGYIYYSKNSGFLEHGTYVCNIEIQALGCLRSNGSLELTRKYRKKGQGLYNRLKPIVEKAAAYAKECERINAAFSAEFEPLKQSIISEYATKRAELISERDTMIEKAKFDEEKKAEILEKIKAINNEMSSLGLFAGKKKKELQAAVAQYEKEISRLLDLDVIQSKYQEKLDELNHVEKNKLIRAEMDLRDKYPLPQH